jgi:ribosomal protein L11 methyltransferase
MNRPDAAHERWLEISVKLPAEFAEPVTHLFSKYGDGRVFVSQTGDWDADDATVEPEASDDVEVYCYLKVDDTVENRRGMIGVGLRLLTELTDVEEHRERLVTAEEWAKQSFSTVRVGDRIVILPWSLGDGLPEKHETGAIEVYLSPGLAFGTGNHPTTRLCLNQIVDDADAGRIAGSRILDLGSGSGVLAIAALKSGASSAWCLDIDETAVRAAKSNLVMSGVAERARVLQGTLPNLCLPDTEFDYVLANITSRVLSDLATPIIDCAKTGGIILASGILEEQLGRVRDRFLDTGLVAITDTRKEGEWVMLRMVKTSSQ